ncbi:MAG: hypothetical protein LBK73_13430 [Treponema sp.]|jgi:hypothetical protein|nr:hypothetical protein [Treponema sp.]
MKTSTTAFRVALGIALCAALVSCSNPEEGGVYTVTISQPSGGAISAIPTSGPAGAVITPSNSPASGYTFSHYTMDGVENEGDAFTLNKDVTVSGVFTLAEPSASSP